MGQIYSKVKTGKNIFYPYIYIYIYIYIIALNYLLGFDHTPKYKCIPAIIFKINLVSVD
jgi:hypothetical protein